MKDQFVLLLNNSYLNSGIPRNSGQFMADQTFHYIESTLYSVLKKIHKLYIRLEIFDLQNMVKYSKNLSYYIQSIHFITGSINI